MPRGNCVFCGQERSINARGLCPACKDVVPCAVHPDQLTIQRCLDCRQPACSTCSVNGVCESCRAERKKNGGKPKKKPAVEGGSRERIGPTQRRNLALLGGVLFIALAGNYYWWFGTAKETPDQVYRERVMQVNEVLQEYLQTHPKPPASLTELFAVAKAANKSLPVMVPASAKVPNAVTYRYDGKRYILGATTDDGKPAYVKGRVIELRIP